MCMNDEIFFYSSFSHKGGNLLMSPMSGLQGRYSRYTSTGDRVIFLKFSIDID